MKRWLAPLVLTLLWASSGWAQKYAETMTLSLQSGLGVAVGDFSHSYGTSIQGLIQGDYAFRDGTSIGVRGGYQIFSADDDVNRQQIKVTQFAVQAKQFFSPDARFGAYGVAGWGIYWWKEDLPSTLSEPEWGGYGGVGLHYEATERVSFFGEGVFNGFFAEPEKITFFGFSIGVTIGLTEE